MDDEEHMLRLYHRLYREEYCVLTSQDPVESLGFLDKQHIDVVVSDYKMPGMNGIEFLRKVKERNSNIKRVIVSATICSIPQEELKELDGVLEKPFNKEDLSDKIKELSG